ncbi:MAG: hypothetical protein K2Q26_12455 [Bdellovibrionales bacterium]|nr:hypothetical protein [Bdellovibrionales bacterium]
MKKIPVTSDMPALVGKTYQLLCSLWWEYKFIRGSLNFLPLETITQINKVTPRSFILPDVEYELDDTTLIDLFKDFKASNTVEAQTFLTMFSLAEEILKESDPDCPWDLPELPTPSNFPYSPKMTFAQFTKYNRSAISEIRETRNCFLHKFGRKDKNYRNNQSKYFHSLDSEMEVIHLALGNRYPYSDFVKKHLECELGSSLEITPQYIHHVQMTLLDHISLKSEYFRYWCDEDAQTLDGVFPTGGEFHLRPTYS